MARRSSKHAGVRNVELGFSLGENFSMPENQITEQESQCLYNFMFDKDGNLPKVRPGIACVTASALAASITKIYHYVKSSTDSWLLCVSGRKLYRLNGTAWVYIADVGNDKPSFLTFNQKLLIGDGTRLSSWDGTTFTADISGGKVKPTSLCEVANRVCCNDTSSTGLDAVWFSKVEDETGWTATAAGGAVMIRCGYKDGSEVVGVASGINNEVIVFKHKKGAYSTYRLPIDLTPYNATDSLAWMAEKLFMNTGASSPHNVCMFDRVVTYLSPTHGLSAILGVQSFSELESGDIGAKINPVIKAGASPDFTEMSYIPKYGSIWILPTHIARVYLYHPWGGGKFTEISFNGLQVMSACQANGIVYFAADNGYLYKLDETRATDQLSPTDTKPVYGIATTKNNEFYGNGIVRKAKVYLEPITGGSVKLYYETNSKSSQAQVLNGSLIPRSDIYDLFEWDTDLTSATEDFSGMGQKPWVMHSYKRFRSDNLTLRLIIEGRCALSGIVLEVADVGR